MLEAVCVTPLGVEVLKENIMQANRWVPRSERQAREVLQIVEKETRISLDMMTSKIKISGASEAKLIAVWILNHILWLEISDLAKVFDRSYSTAGSLRRHADCRVVASTIFRAKLAKILNKMMVRKVMPRRALV